MSDDAVVYFYTPTWHGAPIVELLKDFEGVLQSDGYSGLTPLYRKPQRAPKRAGCLAHARRKLVRALEAGDARAATPLALIRKLYKLEAKATYDGMDNAARLALRQSHSVPLMAELEKELHRLGAQAPPKTLLGTATLLGVRDPWDYLRDILTKLARGWPQSRLAELLPGPWLAARAPQAQPTPAGPP